MGSPVRGFAAVRRFGARLASGPSAAVAVVLLAELVAGQLVAERPGGRPSPAGVVAARWLVVPAAETAAESAVAAAEPFGQPFPVAAVAPVVSQPAEPAALPVAGRLAFGLSAGRLAELPLRGAPDQPAELAAGRLARRL